jgi:hypothetical protein
MFRFFHNLISFSCFGFLAVVPGDPETQTVSHSFPKLCAALRRKFGTDAAYRADGRYVFGLVSRDESHYQWHCLGFCSGDATPLAGIGKWRSLRRPASHLNDARCDAETLLGSTPNSRALDNRWPCCGSLELVF